MIGGLHAQGQFNIKVVVGLRDYGAWMRWFATNMVCGGSS